MLFCCGKVEVKTAQQRPCQNLLLAPVPEEDTDGHHDGVGGSDELCLSKRGAGTRCARGARLRRAADRLH
eukprot:scaffold4194_cov131-Isochrysis_galbana.AAC.6